MGLIGFVQVFNIIIIAIGTLLYLCCKSLTFSSSSSAADSDGSAVADSTAVVADDAADIPPRREKYDVFISFRGEDTRNTFTSHLHAALQQQNIETYIDNRLQRGEAIRPALLEAIGKSTLWVIIFSQNYASSTWCLDELVHILKCNKKGQSVIPIFYHTDASDVRKQDGSYAVAFSQHEKRFKDGIDKVHEWREALTKAANIAGCHHSKNTGTDADLVKKIVEDIWTKLCRESSCDLKGFVGIEGRIEQIESLLGIHSPDACITVGIWGMGGIGKTTLAEAVYHKLSSKFEGCCFLKNVRDREQKDGLERLQSTLFRKILKKEDLSMGSTYVRDMLSRTKVLIVLDDVNSSMQMESLAGERLQYGTGSRIIITSRDKGTLRQTVEEDKIYEVDGLKPDDALELFCSRAFKNKSTRRADYKELAERAVHYAGCVPLALRVLGSLFLNRKSKEEWEDEFNKLKRFSSVDIQKVLRISYDGLGENEKEIFLDIACFHRGKYVDEVKRKLDGRGFFATTGITILIDMSLISMDSKWGRETIELHDLPQEMGRIIVQEQCIEDPSRRKRLFTEEDVYRVLKNNAETPIVEAILVDWHKIQERPLKRANFKVMSNLIMLIVVRSYGQFTVSLDLPDSLRYLDWPSYPLESLPSNFCPENLVELHMPYSRVKKLWEEDQRLVNLEVINLRWSTNLTEVPNLPGSQNLDKLIHIDLGYCTSLKYLPEMPGNITYLDLQNTGINELPESVWSNENISYLNISGCKDLEKLPSNKCKLKVSGSFDLKGCTSLGEFSELPRDISILSMVGFKRLVSLPTNICKLKYLNELILSRCSKLGNFPEILEPMEHLEFLDLSGTLIEELHSSIKFLPALKCIDLRDCNRLSSIPKSICKLKYLEKLNLSRCSKLENFPDILEPMEHLEFLNLSGTAVKELHSSIEFLLALKCIDLRDCIRLSSIPKSICKLKYLEELNLSRCSKLENFPEILEPMEHLVSLSLQGTAVQKLPSSFGNLIGLQTLDLHGCKHLKVVPATIYRLTNLERLNFNACRELEKLPFTPIGFLSLEELDLSKSGILEIPDGLICSTALKYLDLSGTKIRSIPASIKQASRLSTLNIDNCKLIASLDLPDSLRYIYWPGYPLKSLLSNFSLENLVELHMPYSSVKELWNEDQRLVNLKVINLRRSKNLTEVPNLYGSPKIVHIDLSKSGILEIPDGLICSTALKYLDLSGTKIRSIPASIKQASRLSILNIDNCKQLQSLPELPVQCNVEAQGCTALKTGKFKDSTHPSKK